VDDITAARAHVLSALGRGAALQCERRRAIPVEESEVGPPLLLLAFSCRAKITLGRFGLQPSRGKAA
jgi:hypothetical protein